MLKTTRLVKVYKDAKALRDVSIDFPDKGFVFITGKSGSGKSTLLNILGGLDKYDSGDIIIDNKKTSEFGDREWDLYRNTYVGFVFQDFNLLDKYTVFDNVKLALNLQGYEENEVESRTLEILEQVELRGKRDSFTNQLSGGQKQRVAIARALVKNPEIILADEPTGNLDSETAITILDILRNLSKNRLVIMVTHDIEFANVYADRIIELSDGKVIKDHLNENKKNINVSKVIEVDSLEKDAKELLKPYLVEDETHLITTNNKDYVAKYLDYSDSESNNSTKHIKESNSNYYTSIKSKLPFKYIASMIIANIKQKKFRLISVFTTFIISLCSLSFVLLFLTYDTNSVLKEAIPVAETKQFDFSTKTDDLNNYIGDMVTYQYVENLKLENEDAVFGYYDEYVNWIFPTGGYEYELEYGKYGNQVMATAYVNISYLSSGRNNVIVDDFTNISHNILYGTKETDENNVILIPDFVADYILISEIYEQNINSYTDIIGKTVSELSIDNTNEDTEHYKVIGIYETDMDTVIRNTPESDHGVYVNGNIVSQYTIYIKNDYAEEYGLLEGVFVDGPDDLAYELLTTFNTTSNVLFESIADAGENTNSITPVLIVVSIVFTVLTVTLMYQYISMTIEHKKKEIGTLRALGAREFDIFKIYFIETILIMIVTIIFTVIAMYFILNVIDNQYVAQTASSFRIFYFSLKAKLLILTFCIGISFASSYFPIRKITKLKPIDAIRNTNG